MRINRIAGILLRQYYLLRGSPARILPLFAWVAIDIVLWGFISKYLNSFASAGFSFVPTLLGAVLLWDFMVRVMQGVTLAFLEDVWTRNFLNIFRDPALDPRICERPGRFEHRHKFGGSGGDDPPGDTRVRSFVFHLRCDAGAIPSGAVPAWDCARHSGKRDCPPLRTRGGVVHLADSRFAFAVRRCVLSTFDAAAVDEIHCALVAGILRI